MSGTFDEDLFLPGSEPRKSMPGKMREWEIPCKGTLDNGVAPR
ncbi:hypothetical protein MNBD_ALPHA07-882 [hydrothermal vent metagenome]|uniref:Uncharacterized protein n=1 Tax=hydrothermal vent metagenome TaxID=652676 RepID=A0A3B0RUL3_9ZZZZ